MYNKRKEHELELRMSHGIIALQMTNFEKLYKSLNRGQFHKSLNAGIFVLVKMPKIYIGIKNASFFGNKY